MPFQQTVNSESNQLKSLLCNLCQNFYKKGWVSGTGGGITIKLNSEQALIAPSGVQKETISPADLFVLQLSDSQIIEYPLDQSLIISACTSIFTEIYSKRPQTQAIIHSHSLHAVLLTKCIQGASVTFINYEMLKGLKGGKYSKAHTVPILNNVERECDLAEAIGELVKTYPEAHAVLVRDHGVYIWGDNWQQAKVHAECYDFLFEAYIKEISLQALGLLTQ